MPNLLQYSMCRSHTLLSSGRRGVLDNTAATAATIVAKLDVGLQNFSSWLHQGIEVIVGDGPGQVANEYRSATMAAWVSSAMGSGS